MRQEIRNFCIISHIDHGKSTLADRLLEFTNTVPREKMRPQFLDMMDLERERGITIRMQPVRMEYEREGKKYILNLIDTPGHVDFSYEVSRSLSAVEGAILLVDASQGIQAQTMANLNMARKQGLVIIPAVNKIDLPYADVEGSCKEIANLLGIKKEDVLRISAKKGENIDKLVQQIIEKIPPPKVSSGEGNKHFRALVFDSEYDPFKGVIAYIRVVDGVVTQGQKISLYASKTVGQAKEVGYFCPEKKETNSLCAGEIGYIATGIKEPSKVLVGDTLFLKDEKITPLPGFEKPKPMVFASLYPQNPDDFDLLKLTLYKLRLNDPSFTFEPETKEALGRGFRCGFLGTLHVEIVSERIKRETNLDLIISTPSVVYKMKDKKGEEKFIYSPADWPENPSRDVIFQEPWYSLEIVTPPKYLGRILDIFKDVRGNYLETKYINQEKAIISFEVPLEEIVSNLYDKVKSASQGYASMSYEFLGYREADLVKLEILIAGKKQEAFSKIVVREKMEKEARKLARKLKEIIPPQQFPLPIQAVVGGEIIARETKKARRKDVTAPLYGGDYSRKKKLLEKQKKGKKKLKERGQVHLPSEVFLEVFKS